MLTSPRVRRLRLQPSVMIALLIALIPWPTLRAQVPTAPHDEYGVLDTVSVRVLHRGGLQWEAEISLVNDENVAAVTLPFRWHPFARAFRIDSASYAAVRTADFALKTFYPDTVAGTILIGLISDLGTGRPPLEPGAGPIARLHFTAMNDAVDVLFLDTVLISPHNVLQLVTPDARSILPAFSSHKTLRVSGNEAEDTASGRLQ